jgi:hypothetical protein
MEISDLKNALEALSNDGYKPQEYYLIFSRKWWESEMFRINGYHFNKEELDDAEKLDVKLIGIRNGVKCYLPNLFA